MDTEIFVANLDWNVSEEELYGLFAEHGQVESARIPVDRDTGRKRGFAFVKMATPEQARLAISALNEWELKGRPLVVKIAEPKAPRSGGGGFGGGAPRQGGYGNRPRQYEGGGGYSQNRPY